MENNLRRFTLLILGHVLVLAHAVPAANSMMNNDEALALPVVDVDSQEAHAIELAAMPSSQLSSLRFFPATDVGSFIYETSYNSLPSAWKDRADDVTRTVIEEANRHQMDPLFFLAVIKHESHFNPEARGLFGEIGLMQIKPSTAAWLMEIGRIAKIPVDLYNPIDNIRVGAALFARLRQQFKSDASLYVAAYNMGAQNVRALLKESRRPEVYGAKVMKEYQAFYRAMNTRLFAASKIETRSLSSISSDSIQKTIQEAIPSSLLDILGMKSKNKIGLAPAIFDRRRSGLREPTPRARKEKTPLQGTASLFQIKLNFSSSLLRPMKLTA